MFVEATKDCLVDRSRVIEIRKIPKDDKYRVYLWYGADDTSRFDFNSESEADAFISRIVEASKGTPSGHEMPLRMIRQHLLDVYFEATVSETLHRPVGEALDMINEALEGEK